MKRLTIKHSGGEDSIIVSDMACAKFVQAWDYWVHRKQEVRIFGLRGTYSDTDKGHTLWVDLDRVYLVDEASVVRDDSVSWITESSQPQSPSH